MNSDSQVSSGLAGASSTSTSEPAGVGAEAIRPERRSAIRPLTSDRRAFWASSRVAPDSISWVVSSSWPVSEALRIAVMRFLSPVTASVESLTASTSLATCSMAASSASSEGSTNSDIGSSSMLATVKTCADTVDLSSCNATASVASSAPRAVNVTSLSHDFLKMWPGPSSVLPFTSAVASAGTFSMLSGGT